MVIESKIYGTIEIDEKQIFQFPYGLPGFDDLTAWALFEAKEKPFYILQSLQSKDVSFFMIDPLTFRPDYVPSPPENDLLLLKLNQVTPSQACVLVIVNIPDNDPMRITANLQAPVIFNLADRIAGQCISTDIRWQIRHVISDELQKEA